MWGFVVITETTRWLTVNQPPYGFAGSSPASPTSLRSLRELRLGKPAPMVMARSERRLSRRSPQGAGGLGQSVSHPIISRTIGTTFRP